jgi:hypothetical protein
MQEGGREAGEEGEAGREMKYEYGAAPVWGGHVGTHLGGGDDDLAEILPGDYLRVVYRSREPESATANCDDAQSAGADKVDSALH